MTCIVGLKDGDRVLIGGDSAGITSDLSLTVRSDAKVFQNEDFLIGFTSSFRMGQLLRYSFKPPKRHPSDDIHGYMVTSFVDGVRDCLKSGGYARRVDEAEDAGSFPVGYCGRLFLIEDDYQVAEGLDGYAACGCGAQIALGSLYSTADKDPDTRVRIALEAAERFSAGVRAPFQVRTA